MNDRDRSTFLASTPCSSRAMRVVLNVIRQSEVDDMRQIVDIESTCSHIGSYQQLCQMVTELLHGKVSLLLTQITMQRLCIIAVLNQFVCYFLRFDLRATEDNGKDTWIIVNDTFQREILILGIHHIIDMVHILSTLITTTHHNLLVVVQVFLGHTLHLLTHGGREHQRVMFCRQRLEYLVDTVRKAHVQHLISLVKNDIRHLFQTGKATMHQVHQSSWCRHNDIHTFL